MPGALKSAGLKKCKGSDVLQYARIERNFAPTLSLRRHRNDDGSDGVRFIESLIMACCPFSKRQCVEGPPSAILLRTIAITFQPKPAKALRFLQAQTTFLLGRIGRNLVGMFKNRRAFLHGQFVPEPAYHDNHP